MNLVSSEQGIDSTPLFFIVFVQNNTGDREQRIALGSRRNVGNFAGAGIQ